MSWKNTRSRDKRKDAGIDLRIVFLIFLLILSVYIVKNYGKLQRESLTPVNNGNASEMQVIDAETEVEQRFKGNGLRLTQINIYFGNNYYENCEGDIVISLLDDEGKTIQEVTKPAREIKNLEYLSLKVDQRLKRGKTYSIKIKGNEMKASQGPSLYKVEKKMAPNEVLTVNGQSVRGSLFLFYVFPIKMIGNTILLIFVLLLLLGIGMIYVPKGEKYRKDNLTENWNIAANILFYLVPLVGFYFVEHFTKNNWKSIYPLAYVFNILLYYCAFGILYFIFGNKKIVTVLFLGLFYLLGAVNYFVLSFRGIPVLPSDLASIGTAKNVASNYSYEMTTAFISNLILFLYVCTIVCKNKKFKKTKVAKRGMVCILSLLGLAITVGFIKQETFLASYNIKANVWNQKKGYSKTGALFGFAINCKYLSVEKPEGYSTDKVREIAQEYLQEDEPSGRMDDRKPNIIVIMDEAFSDLSVVGEFETNKKVMPFIQKLKKNTVRGSLYVSVFGGNTCNTELEFLTGDTMAFLPNGSIGYTQILKGKTSNLTSKLKSQGYEGNHALHPYIAEGWNRPKVYEWFGFDEFISQDSFQNPEMVRQYISDEEDFEKIIQLYEETKEENPEDPYYVFNVTMQNHGGYKTEYENFEQKIEITDENMNEEANQYLSLMKKTDTAFKELVEYFSNTSDPTLIVLFGDHEPSISDRFYEKLYGKKLDELTQEELQRKYQTPYLIWANYDIEEEEKDMSANYLSSYLLKVAGLEMAGYDRFLLDLQEKVPIINAVGYIGKDGKHYTYEEESPYLEEIENYKILQYNHLIDWKHRYDEFYE